MSPLISHLYETGEIEAVAKTQTECFAAGVLFARTEGIVPAPEPTHALAAAVEEALRCKETGEEKVILTALCGHGHLDLPAYDAYLSRRPRRPHLGRRRPPGGRGRGADPAARHPGLTGDATMASWQTHAVCVYLRATRKKRYRTAEAGLQSMAHGLPAAPLPDELRDRTSVAPLGRWRGGHGAPGRRCRGRMPARWSTCTAARSSTASSRSTGRSSPTSPTPRTARCTSRATRWRPRTTSRDAETFLAALHERFAPDGAAARARRLRGRHAGAAAGPGPRRRRHASPG